jgi:predicted metal-binding membrane protein
MNALRGQSRTTVLLVAGTVAAWVVTVDRMRGMDAGPGTDLGGLGWYLGIWVTMTAAMMLPSAAPTAAHVARLVRRMPTVLFVTGYLAVWTVYGLAAYGIYKFVSSVDTGWLAWNEHGRYVAGAAIAAVGIYELTPSKRSSLRRCRSARHRRGALESGLGHGVDCVTCSAGLMAVLFVLGMMSLFWMVLVAVAIFAEKVLPYGARLTAPLAVGLVALGIWVGVSPGSVPGLTEPGNGPPSMEMGS